MTLLTVIQGVTPLQWVTGAFALFIAYIFAAAIYNLYFSPLAKYPGPFLAKISVWPSHYHTWRGNRHIWIWQCHQIYGSSFRHRPDGLLFNSPTAYRSIYNFRANVTKGTFYKIYPRKANEHNTWNCVDNAKHAKKRRVLNHVFSGKAVRSAETFVIQHVNRWCELLGENTENEWSTPRNMALWADYLVFDILGDLLFGKSMRIKEPGENMLKAIGNAPFTDFWIWLKPRGLDSLVEVLLPKGVQVFFKWIEASIAERTKLEEDFQKQDDEKNARKDMFHYFIQAKDPETGLPAYTPDELFTEAHLLITAGSDTSTTTLAGTIFYLTRNPRVYARLVQEIHTTFQTVDEIRSGAKLLGCSYLRACLDEAMRMSPPVAGELPREVLPGGIEVDGKFVPEGTQIGIGIYSIHHNEDCFPDPFVYRPERFIEDEKSGVSAADLARAESALVPFSIGPRACVGKNLAYLELFVALARLLYLLDIRVPNENTLGQGAPDLMWGRRNKNEYQVNDNLTSSKEGPIAQFKRR
ncbi:hypothetical protein MMC07_001058 [Pseudocyphellaria aurata]|nr:hypothetical protein [Pseudocyphellaria aurata]